ncbi:hypothetical protein DF185_09495 [Marinifilum breve]|uniref:Uncharacterized protein n=1 Tax=Marinifilum breve TaxID=2184082 RepID=A0A2V3ZYX1_9BACT|nr:chondroitinase family polysaccharide lyase [Marinifilum breve]PXY01692.1 hypothetical protein DF185_09495 [Marinifilum breve]
MQTKKHTILLHCFKQVLLIACVLISAKLSAQDIFVPEIISFEGEQVNSQWSADSKSELQVSKRHFKHGNQSLKWTWEQKGILELDQNINFTPFNPEAVDKSIPTFCFWVYNETPKNEKITVQFATDTTVNCEFKFGLNYKGWRAAWVAFERDMKGTPVTSMNKMKIIAPENTSGSLYFDHIMLCTPADSRWNTPDYQVPFVNAKTKNHWLVLYKSSLNKPKQKLGILTDKLIKGIQVINKRYTKSVIKKVKVTDKLMNQIRKDYAKYKISRSEDQITGENIWFCRFSEIYRPYTKEWKNYFNKHNKGFKKYTKLMYDVACAYNQTDNVEYKSELEELFFNLSDHLIDQGWAEGSANGTVHHLGYSMRTYYSAYFLMRGSLIKTKRLDQAQKAMEWYSGVKEIYAPFHGKGMSIDAFNTSVMGRLASILILEDSPEKVRYLNAYIAWINNGLEYAPGLEDSFKVDGSVFHHGNNYPAYATGGYDGATAMVYFFSRTPFHISQEGHRILKESLLKTRLFCNKETWPLSMSGRHPKGTGKLNPIHYGLMALAGTPDGKEKIDPEMASAYLRLAKGKKSSKWVKTFEKKGFKAENDPQGNWTMNYAALGIHRRDNWSVTAQGHSRYLWAAEHYIGANYYGRYMKHGQVQILCGDKKVSNFTSGFEPKGWDWNKFPGTTAIHLPIDELEANILNVDQVTGYEEMLISDEAFAGALSHEGNNGLWAMKLHEHDKYNGSLRANKSAFFFDNRIVLLGSNIENNNQKYETATTLFQNHLKNKEDEILFNGKFISQFPYNWTGENKKATTLTDLVGNSYYIPSQYNVKIEKKLQHSKDQKKKTPNQGNFASAIISHGKAPQKSEYEYAILVQDKGQYISSFAKQMKKNKKAPYLLLQKDSKAHIVFDRASNSTGYVLFEENTKLTKGDITSISAPALVMISKNNNKAKLSLCDPDLHLYEGAADVVIENGKRKERSVYSRDWYKNESKTSKIRITIKGEWSLQPNEYCKLLESNSDNTTLEFSCQHGLTREVELQKK